jgi:hypothetical protein
VIVCANCRVASLSGRIMEILIIEGGQTPIHQRDLKTRQNVRFLYRRCNFGGLGMYIRVYIAELRKMAIV